MRTLRVLLSLLVSAALIGVAAPLPVAAQPDSTPPNTGSGKVAGLSGYLLTEQGQPRSDRKVTLNALELLPNGDYVSRPIDSAITAANGRFELAADLSGVQLLNGDARLEFIYQALPGEPGFYYPFMATPGDAVGEPWTVPLPNGVAQVANSSVVGGTDVFFMLGKGALDAGQVLQAMPSVAGKMLTGDLFASDSRSTAVAAAGGSGSILNVPDGESGRTVEEEEGSQRWDAPAVVPRGSSNIACKDYEQTLWDRRDDFRYDFVPNKYMRTLGKSSQTWRIARTWESSFQLGINVNGTKYGGALWGNTIQTDNISSAPTAGPNQRVFWMIKEKYQKFRAYCHYDEGPEGNPDHAYNYDLDVWRWEPIKWTGGNIWSDTGSFFSCGGTGAAYTDQFAAPTTISRDTTVTFGGGFSIVGIKLDSRSSDMSSQTLTVTPVSGKTPKYCGDTGAPLYANLAKEIT